MTILKDSSRGNAPASRVAMRFVLLIGVLSFFADLTHEGSRSILGPFLASMQASAFVVGVVTGFGELAGYGLRYFSGRFADSTGRFWPTAITGYVVQMAAVPALSLTRTWHSAAFFIILERIGRAIRNPPRDVMLSHAAKHIGGYGWTFGIHEACDQFGAMFGPLLMAAVLSYHGSYQLAFTVLLVPAVLNLIFVLIARLLYPRPQDLDENPAPGNGQARFSSKFWVYLSGACLVAVGFTDYPLLAYHFTRAGTASTQSIAVFYSVAMAVSGIFTAVWPPLRPVWLSRIHRPDLACFAFRPSGISRKLLAGSGWRSDLGHGYGCA